jgi:hypothetical protein
MCRRGARSSGQWGRWVYSCMGVGGAAGIKETKHKNHSNSAQQKSVNQVCILKVHRKSLVVALFFQP